MKCHQVQEKKEEQLIEDENRRKPLLIVPWNLSPPGTGVMIKVTRSSNNICDVQANVVSTCSTQQPCFPLASHHASYSSFNTWMHMY